MDAGPKLAKGQMALDWVGPGPATQVHDLEDQVGGSGLHRDVDCACSVRGCDAKHLPFGGGGGGGPGGGVARGRAGQKHDAW